MLHYTPAQRKVSRAPEKWDGFISREQAARLLTDPSVINLMFSGEFLRESKDDRQGDLRLMVGKRNVQKGVLGENLRDPNLVVPDSDRQVEIGKIRVYDMMLAKQGVKYPWRTFNVSTAFWIKVRGRALRIFDTFADVPEGAAIFDCDLNVTMVKP
jgi:hypothetical protein